MDDQSPWDHLDYAGKHLNPVAGRIDIDVNDRTNTGQVVAEFQEGTDHYRVVFDRFVGAQPFKMAESRLGSMSTATPGGDPLYPKTWLYLAGWGRADL